MTDDFKNGLITGFAMQPLFVTTNTAPHGGDNICSVAIVCADVINSDGYCKYIATEQDG